jgi:hypothetical protein
MRDRQGRFVANGVLSEIPSVTASAIAACFVNVMADSIWMCGVEPPGLDTCCSIQNSLPDAQANDKDRKFEQAEKAIVV